VKYIAEPMTTATKIRKAAKKPTHKKTLLMADGFSALSSSELSRKSPPKLSNSEDVRPLFDIVPPPPSNALEPGGG
jgi:hypothetical protein